VFSAVWPFVARKVLSPKASPPLPFRASARCEGFQRITLLGVTGPPRHITSALQHGDIIKRTEVNTDTMSI
jgi:hypothetical protein